MARVSKGLKLSNRCLEESRIEEREFLSKETFRAMEMEMAELEIPELAESYRPL